jgi:hypothetical protein
VRRAIPAERWAALTSVAEASKSERVLVVCTNSTVRSQYERAIPKLGGNLDNVFFVIPSDAVPDGVPDV